MTTTTPRTRVLPEDIHPAYDWTDSAGELDDLRASRAPERYASESEQNARDSGVYDVHAADLIRLRAWLRQEPCP